MKRSRASKRSFPVLTFVAWLAACSPATDMAPTVAPPTVAPLTPRAPDPHHDEPQAAPTPARPLDDLDVRLAEVARVHGGAGPWAVAGYRMGEYALKNLELPRGSFDLEVVHHTPSEVQYACIADGASAATGASMGKLNLSLEPAKAPETRTTYRNRATGRAITLRVSSSFATHFRDIPQELLGSAGHVAMVLPDADVFEAVPEPNSKVLYFGVDGELSADEPDTAATRDGGGVGGGGGGGKCTADYAAGGRNPGLVRLVKNETFSFYEDRDGKKPLAESCRYKYVGFTPDPKYFGIGKDQSPTSLWLKYELAAGSPACEAKFHFVTLRAPEGVGAKRHLHLRYGGRGTSLDALVRLSVEPARPGNACDPWWSVYCTRGLHGCDDD